AVWDQLMSGDALYFRAWFSKSSTAWLDAVATTADSEFASAPSIAITGAAPARAAPTKRDVPAQPLKRDAPAMYAGFDRLSYPGDDVMQALYAHTNLTWTGFYLAPAPSQGYTGWMDKAATLRSMGWGLAPIFVGQQWPGGPGSHVLTSEQGTADAQRSVQLADQAGVGQHAVIYLDIEVGGELPATFLAYAQAWLDGVRLSAYRPGVYCSFL